MVILLQPDALNTALLRNVQKCADELSDCPNYWISREDLESHNLNNPAEAAVAALQPLVQPHLPDNWTGAEYWVQVYEAGRGLAFHFDKDEHAMKENGAMVNPILSSVLYLTGNNLNSDSKLQAPTVINDQRYSQEHGCTVPEDPTCSTIVFPLENSYLLFGGDLGHGVLDAQSTDRRATLLVNWWREQPQAITTAAADGDGILETMKQLVLDGADNPPVSSPSSTGKTKAILVGDVPIIHVTNEDLEAGDLLMVDDLLLKHKIVLKGSGATQAVILEHPSLALYPVDNEQWGREESLVGAALVSLDAFSDSESSGVSE